MSIKDRLYDKMQAEYDSMIEELKGLPTEQIINRAYEKVAKEDLLACFVSEEDFTDEKIQALYNLEYPLDTLYQGWMDTDVSFSDTFRDSIDESVRELLSSTDMEQTLLSVDTNGLVLSDLLSFELADIHLCHSDEEHDLATIVELGNETLTDEGRQDWFDVLNAKVEKIYNSDLGLTIDLSGVSAQRLTDFSYMLAGNVSVKDYERWVYDSESSEQKLVLSEAEIRDLGKNNPAIADELRQLMPTSQAINGEIRPEDWVIAIPDDDYGCLIGMVTKINKLGTPEHDAETENETDDIHVDFTVVDYPERRIKQIEEDFSNSYGEPKIFDELPLDDVIMAPDTLIRITGIHLDDLSKLVNDYYTAEEYCNSVTGKKDKMVDELTDRVNKNYSDYLDSLQGFGNSELIDMASKIHAVSDAYSYMTMYHEYDEHELEFFLQFQNPLEVVADEWRDRNIYVSDVSDVIEYLYESSDDLLEAYPLMCDADVSADTSLRRFMGVNLNDFLGKIAEKTIIHYPNDWNIDVETLTKAAESHDPNEKRLVWHVCATSTHLKREREVFIRDSGDYDYMTDYHQNDPDMFGYFVEVTGMSGKDVIGNVFEVGNYANFARHIRNVAEPLESLTLIYSDQKAGVNAGKAVTVSRKEYDDDRNRLMSKSGFVNQVVYHPQDKVRLAGLLTGERSRRMSYPLGSTGAHLRKMADILREVRKPPEQTAENPKKSLEDKLKSAKEKADAHNAQKVDKKTSKKRDEII